MRRTRGDDIDAACGPLKGQVLDRTRRNADFQRRVEAGRLEAMRLEAAAGDRDAA